MNILEKIEKIIKEADTYLTEQEIFKRIKNEEPINLRLFVNCMDILESIGKIIIEKDRYVGNEVYWVGVDNPKLEKLLKESVIL